MSIRVLAVGDVVGSSGVSFLRRQLGSLIRTHAIDFTVVNGENASMRGLTPDQAEDMLYAGADVITLGNHTFGNRAIVPYLDDSAKILRPANFPSQNPGRGWGDYETDFGTVRVINLIGRCSMNFGPENPFSAVDTILAKAPPAFVLVDFHAEATSEKLAMGYLLDGRVSALWGTHTHVQTSDGQVLPGGTGYVTDLGMTGPARSVLGVRPEQSVAMFRGELPERFAEAKGKVKLEGAIFELEEKSGRCLSVEALRISES